MLNALKVAVVISAVDKMSRVVKDAVDNSSKHLVRFSKEANRIGDSAFEVGRQAGALGLGILAPIGLAVKAAANYETMAVSLKTAFQGNEEAANSAFKVIEKFAATTPYQLEEVMSAFVRLKNLGLDPSNETLTAYGNTASSMGKSLNDMIEAVADASTGEFERLKEFGIRASKQGDIVKFTFQGVTTAVKFNSDSIQNYLKNIGTVNFAGGMEAQSKTLNGRFSTLKDNVVAFGVRLGNVLMPKIVELTDKIKPLLDRVEKWITKNPELTSKIMITVTAVGVLSFAVSAFAFTFGGVMKVVAFGSTVFSTITTAVTLFSGGLAGATVAFKALDTAMKANIIILIASLIAAAAVAIYMNWDKIKKLFTDLWNGPLNNRYIQAALVVFFPFIGLPIVIIKNWEKIKQFFINLWEGVKNVFRKAFQGIKAVVWDYHPYVLIYNNWDKIVAYFGNLWTKVKMKFLSFFDWFANLHIKFYKAGVNIVNSVWDGMKSKFNDMVKWFKDGLQEMRNMLPFSPAKTGPLKDIHRLKFVETIAQNIKPAPMVNAMSKALNMTKEVVTGKGAISGNSMSKMSPALSISGGGGGGGGSVVVNFSPTINMSGASGGSKQDFLAQLKEYEPQLMRVIKEAMVRQERKKFA